MTLVLAVTGRDSIWMVTDRRLSFQKRSPRDDAIKSLSIERTDGIALLGYAGLGATVTNTQPSDWMSNVIRGTNEGIEPTLVRIARAVEREVPKHLSSVLQPSRFAHVVLAPAFLNEKAQLFAIELELGTSIHTVYTRRHEHRLGKPPRVAIAGSGALYFRNKRATLRQILRLVRQHEAGRLTNLAVADELAAINYLVSEKEATVGPNCLVRWAYRRSGRFKGGGGFQFYSGIARHIGGGGAAPPMNVMGIDMKELGAEAVKMLSKLGFGSSGERPRDFLERSVQEMNSIVAKASRDPDDELR